MHQRNWRVSNSGPDVARDLAGNHAQECPTIARRQERDPGRTDVLVARWRPLLPRRQVDPQLDAVEETAAGDQRLGRPFDVENPGARRHPLRRTIGDQPASAG